MRPGVPRAARIKLQTVDVDCSTCDVPLYEDVDCRTPVPWGTTVTCDICGCALRLPPTPFSTPFLGTAAILGR